MTDGRVSLRASAFVELHLWLSAAARTDEDVGTELAPAKRAYARSLQDDDQDVLLQRTTRALSACSDDRCASAAVASEGFGRSYDRALPSFLARSWLGRASSAWIGIEAAHGAIEAAGPAMEVLFARAASDIGTSWPDGPVTVEVVSEAPPVGRAALAPIALAAQGRCFLRDRQGDERANQARILDCVLVHALLASATEHRGALHDAVLRDLGDRDGERAWSLLVIHAVAAVVTGWEPKHRSVYRRSAEAAELTLLDWLAREWPKGRTEGTAFGARFAAEWREVHR